MSEAQPPAPDQGTDGGQAPRPAIGVLARLSQVMRIVQVRLRFVLLLVLAFVVVGQWSTLRTYFDALWHRVGGGHDREHTVSDDTEFFCPMDPGVVSDWPAICPICNMDLVRRKKGEAAILPEGVVARMQFSPYRIQFAGLKTSIIARRPLVRTIELAGRLEADPENAGRLVLGCEAFDSDLPFLKPGREATISVAALPGAPSLKATLRSIDAETGPGRRVALFSLEREGGEPIEGLYAVARIEIPIADVEAFASITPNGGSASDGGWPALPESAVVHSGGRQVVYVETMPGMFDGVEVALGPRCGDYYPVISGVEVGQKVVTMGAFLIDAEARLNPSLAAGYFGAARFASDAGASTAIPESEAEPARPPRRATKKKEAKATLSAADLALVKRQKNCPVTDLSLDSMGGPVPVEISGRRVFLCCPACEATLRKDPAKYLAKVPSEK